MSYVVFAFGLALSIGGAWAVYFGYGIVSVERGWASMIAGAAALSGGVVTMALGLILNSLSKLRTVLEAEPSAIPLPGEVRLYPDEDYQGAYAESFEAQSFQVELSEAPAPGGDAGEPPETVSENASLEKSSWRQPVPAAETMDDIRRIVAEKVRARTGIVDALAPPPEVGSSQTAPPPGASQIADDEFGEAEDYDPRPVERAPPNHAAPADHAPGQAEHEPEETAPPAPALQEADGRVVTRRYESGGAVYVMYADGSIEAQSEHGIMHFESMAELKAFMDSQPRGAS